MPSNLLRVMGNQSIAPGIYRMTLPAPAPDVPGQFYMLRAQHSAYLLPRPISVSDWQAGLLHFVYQVAGRATGELSRLTRGDRVQLTGPLGNGYDLDALTGPVALVSGGVGAAPMLLTARLLRRRGMEAHAYLGFGDHPFLLDELAEQVNVLSFSTESGRAGHHGLVTELLEAKNYGAVLCCGPAAMMKAVTAQCQAAGVPVWISTECRMACGLGACLTCTCADKQGVNHRSCVDGPVFRGEAMNLDA